MRTFLQLLGAVALLIPGTHMLQRGILRACGALLRRVLGHSMLMKNRLRVPIPAPREQA